LILGTSGTHWEHIKHTLSTHWKRIGHALETHWAHIGHFSSRLFAAFCSAFFCQLLLY
jgi:hypothetical protein